MAPPNWLSYCCAGPKRDGRRRYDKQAKLEFDYQDADELPDEVDQRLSEIEAALMAFEDRSVVYDPADIARAGVFVSIDSEGRLSVDRGYVRPEDELPAAASDSSQSLDAPSTEGQEASTSVQRTAISIAGHPAETGEEDDEDAAKPLPDRLITELTAHCTLALRDALAQNPAITFLSGVNCCGVMKIADHELVAYG